MTTRTPDPIIPFGQHKGLHASEIDVKYLDWLLGQPWLKEPLASQIQAHLRGRPEWHALDDEGD